MSAEPTSVRTHNRLVRGGAAFAASATAALAAPVTHVLETPLVTDATETTATPQLYIVNVFTNEQTAVSAGAPPSGTYTAGTVAFGSVGVLDSAEMGKPAFVPILSAYTFLEEGSDFVSARFVAGSGKPLVPFGTSTEISNSSFLETDAPTGGLLGLPYMLNPEDPSSYNTWLSGETNQFFVPFNIISGTSSVYGYLEFAYDAPSVSLALLSYGYDDAGDAITTPSAFTAYTPPEDFVLTPIPESSSYAVGAALVAGSVALYRRRRSVVAA